MNFSKKAGVFFQSDSLHELDFSAGSRRDLRFLGITFWAVLFGLTSVGWASTQYLQLPSSGGGTTSWSSSAGTVGTSAGNTVATSNGGGTAAAFSLVGQIYALTSDAYLDVSALGAGTYTIASTASTIDLNGHVLSVKALAGQTVAFGALLSNSQTPGGLTVLGGGAVLFDNTASQYASGMNLGALAVAGSTVTLPANIAFGLSNNGSGVSYSSINLTSAAILVLGNGVAIGSRSISSSVPISLDTGSLKLAGGGATASLTPKFVSTSTAEILTLDSNGGTLTLYGNNANGAQGSGVTLAVNDSAATTGTVTLYGSHNASTGGNNFDSSNATVAAGTLNLQLDAGDGSGQSIGGIDLTGGVLTGSANFGGDVTMAGASQLIATSFMLVNLSMSNSAKLSGVVTLAGDLNLTGSAVFSPAAATTPTNLSANLNANSGSPHFVVSYNGTDLSKLAVNGLPDIANLEVDLLLAAGTYATGTQGLTIITAGYLGTASTIAPRWNIAGVYLDAGHTVPAIGDEIALTLSASGNDFHLGLTINRALYVVTSATPNYLVPFLPIPPNIASVNRTDATPTNAASLGFTVTFSEAVTGVDSSDFALSTTSTAAGTIASVTGSGAVYTVTVNAVGGNGTLRLDLNSSGTGITNAEPTAIATGFTSGQTYTIDTTAPAAPSGFAANATSGTIALTWNNPADGDFSSCSIRRSTSAFPTTIGSGTAVGSGLTGTSLNQTSLTDGPYYYAIFALDTAGNISAAATASATVDTVTATPTLSAPGNGTTDNASFAFAFNLPEAAAAGSVKLTYTRTGGTPDSGSPHVLTFGGGFTGAGPHSGSLNAADFSADPNIVSFSGGAALVQGAVYTVSLEYRDGLNNPVATATTTTVTYDDTTATPTLTTPASNGVDNATFAVAFMLPEVTMSGSVSLTFTRTGGTADAGSPHVLTFAGGLASAGTHTATLNAANFLTDASVVSLSGGAALADGASYIVTLAYQDAIGNPTATATSTGVTYDNSVATPAAPALSVGSDSGSSSSDGITNNNVPRIEGTAEANGMLEIFIDSTFAFSIALDGTGNWWFDRSPAFTDGVHTVATRVTDRAGNISATSAPLTLTIDTAAPTAPTSFNAVANTSTIALSWTNPVSDFASCTIRRSSSAYPTTITSGTAVASNLTGTNFNDTALADGTYYYAIFVVDAAGNVSVAATASATADSIAPTVMSIVRTTSSYLANATSVGFTVTFSKSVSGVDSSDFALTVTGTLAGTIASVSSVSGTSIQVVVGSLVGDGTLRLDVKNSGTGIVDAANNSLSGGFTAGEIYTFDHTAPAAPSTPATASNPSTGQRPVITGTAEVGSTVKLYAGSTLIGTTTAIGSNWSITPLSDVAEGVHLITATATDAVGNVSAASGSLTLVVSLVIAAPSITTQPQSQAAFVGSNVNLIVATSGTPTISYQWQKEGISIPGATGSTLALANVQLSDASHYAVIATNSYGSVTSKFARVVIIQAQPNAIVYASTVSTTGVTAGGSVNLAYYITNVGTKTWGSHHYLSIRDVNNAFVAFSSLIGVLPGESTTATLNFPAPTTPGTYTYYVQGLEDGVEFFSTQTTLTLTVLAPLTNSITYNTTTFPVSAAPGSNVVFTYNVTNTGTQAWGANHILSLKNSGGTTLSSTLLTVLAPGGSKTVNLSFTAPTAPGTYNYTVQASQTGVGDFNTHADLTLTVLAPRPNAIVYMATRLPDEVVPGATINLSYSLSNAGTQAWGAGHYVSLRDETGAFLAFLPLNGIAQGGQQNVAFSFSAPTTPGLHTYYVQALEDGVEFFSTQEVVIIQVAALPLANAITYNATTFPSTVTPGATVNFTCNITNRGTRTWGTSDYLSFRDVDNTFLGFPSISGVAPGAGKTVNISFTAPTTPGIYTYKVQALQDGVAFFAMDDTVVLFVQ